MLTTTTDAILSPLMVATGRRVRMEALLAAGFIFAWVLSLSRSLCDPMGYDQALYQYMTDRILAGGRLYVDVWDQNTPGIVAIHWLSTRLFGSEPISLRLFDAGWQLLTLAALFGLAARDGRRWSAGWLAATLYVLSYYSMGYVHTAQREGFAVLPLLISVHLVVTSRRYNDSSARSGLRFLLAGVLGLFVFSIKPPLGLGYGVLWIHTLWRNLNNRREGTRAFVPVLALSAGFLLAAAASAWMLVRLGAWEEFLGVLNRRGMNGYVLGPEMIRSLGPTVAFGMFVFSGLAIVGRKACREGAPNWWSHLSILGFAFFVLLVTCLRWVGWQHVLLCFSGLWIPAVGTIALAPWRGRSEIWRLCMLILAAATAALVLQGQFFLYHLPPLFATAAYLAAVEIEDLCNASGNVAGVRPVWLSLCLGSVGMLAVGQWWPTMTFVTAHPYVLAGTTLADHYDSITKHKLSCPKYSTTVRVARRIAELTATNEPIASLFHDVRLYQFAQRPSVHKLVSMHLAYQHLFPDYMQAIRDRRPKVITARIPEGSRQSRDLAAIQEAVFAEAESFFGAPGRTIRELYHVTELIDDVCLLSPN